MEEKLNLILEALSRIESKLQKIDCQCKENGHDFIREVGANMLGDYLFTILDENWIRRNNLL